MGLWKLLVTGWNFPEIACWWLRHDASSRVLVLRNLDTKSIKDFHVVFWFSSGENLKAHITRLRADEPINVCLDKLPDWDHLLEKEQIIFVEIRFENDSFCFINQSGKLHPSSRSPELLLKGVAELKKDDQKLKRKHQLR